MDKLLVHFYTTYYQHLFKTEPIVSTKFNGTEVIKVRDIPNIIDSLPYEYIVASNYGEVETEAWVKE